MELQEYIKTNVLMNNSIFQPGRHPGIAVESSVGAILHVIDQGDLCPQTT